MNASTKIAVTLVAGMSLFASAAADAQVRGRARTPGGMVVAGKGPNGTVFARGGGKVTNPDGSVTTASGGAFRGPNGGAGGRASTTTVNPDGSATRRSAAGGVGPNGGRFATTGGATRNADGSYSASRSSTATGPNGVSYQGNTSYDAASGVKHSGTCYNAAGAVVPCH